MDERGWFSETFHERRLAAIGINCRFVQDNQSRTVRKGTLRGPTFPAAARGSGQAGHRPARQDPGRRGGLARGLPHLREPCFDRAFSGERAPSLHFGRICPWISYLGGRRPGDVQGVTLLRARARRRHPLERLRHCAAVANA